MPSQGRPRAVSPIKLGRPPAPGARGLELTRHAWTRSQVHVASIGAFALGEASLFSKGSS